MMTPPTRMARMHPPKKYGRNSTVFSFMSKRTEGTFPFAKHDTDPVF
jgi:hypothetical protein